MTVGDRVKKGEFRGVALALRWERRLSGRKYQNDQPRTVSVNRSRLDYYMEYWVYNGSSTNFTKVCGRLLEAPG